MNSELVHLGDPTAKTDILPLDTGDIPGARKMYADMVLIRLTEATLGDLVLAGEIGCPCHLAIGQEAVAVGVSRHLSVNDHAFGAHRSHGHFLAAGGTPESLIAEAMGKATGASGGFGGSMHLRANGTAFRGSVPIVAGTVPLAAGAALAAKLRGNDSIGLAWFGDGACEEGVVHETLNLAAVMKLPIIFVVENNLYASHLDIRQRQPSDSVSRFAKAHRIESRLVDGNDALAVSNAARDLVARARAGHGPGFLESVTYRWRGHVGPDENIDVGLRRSATELAAWKQRDPIARLRRALVKAGCAPDELDLIDHAARGRVRHAVSLARRSPNPDPANIGDNVLARARLDCVA